MVSSFRVALASFLFLTLGIYTDRSPLLAASFQHSYALVVGISDYSSSRWKHLDYAEGDARAIASRLRAQGYVVTELYGRVATKHNILAALDDLAGKVGPDDRVVVFLSGHGTLMRVGANTFPYIVPFDGVDSATYVSRAELDDASAHLQTARHQLFIIDACYGGLMVTRDGVPPDTPNYIQEVTDRIARDVITAGGGDQEVLDTGPNGHSVFANALLEGLEGQADLNKDGYITFAELEVWLKWNASNAYQTPATGVLPGHKGGEYVFDSPLGRTARPVETAALPKIVVKKGDTNQLAEAKELLNSSRFSEAVALLRTAASSGNAEAMFYLGRVYDEGWGVKQDAVQATTWYRKAAEAGHPAAMNNLGWSYKTGRGVERDYAQALIWFHKAADAGNSYGMDNIAAMYRDGLGVSKDYAQALIWYHKAADAGNSDAMNGLGWMYKNGIGVATDYQQAVTWFRKAAEAGDAGGMDNLAVMYRDGLGVSKDYAQALMWYRKAVDGGSPDAMNGLGWAYRNGLGVERDYQQAATWFRRAVDAGDSNGMNNLGVMYRDGLGVEKDYSQALNWFRRAAQAGDGNAMASLGYMYQYGMGVEMSDNEAVNWYRKGADAGDSMAMNNLGWMFEKGYGVAENRAQALSWYRGAAKLGNDRAKQNLNRLGETP